MSTDAYKFRLDRPLDREVRRIFRSQVTRARRSLKSADDLGVHTARKAIKRARAVLRLIRGGISPERYRELDRALKGIGRRLAGVRDGAVAVTLTEMLTVERAVKSSVSKGLSEHLETVRDAAWKSLLADEGIEEIRSELNDIRLSAEELEGMRAHALYDGLTETYTSGKERLALAIESPNADSLHGWRRQTKHYGYQLRLLTPAWPLVLRAEARAIDTLSESLGDHHDLSELLRLAKESDLDKNAFRSLQRQVQKRCKSLEATIWPLGARIYAEDGAAIAQRMTVYLAAALAEEHGIPVHPLDGMAPLAPPNHPLRLVS